MKEMLKRYRLSPSEYDHICKILSRPPQGVEWALFSALWSEHCSYKSSKVHLRKFGKTLDAKVINAVGENAGVLDLGKGERIVFKMESHNHPSFIEPFQGAATGVGGILRDIFTMGARPVALADYLCFGEPQAPRMKSIVDGVVRGIAGYGNSVGVPTITGQTEFHSTYNTNVLVNAMAVGLLRSSTKVALSAARGIGNDVVYVGAKTGRDGVHGAAMASESFDDSSDAKKPNVQIGDPYFEKLLIESCLEILEKDLVMAIQDMGAAGLTSSSFEMASKGQIGMDLFLDQIPLRDNSLTPEDILLSESQERMLLVCEPGHFKEIQTIMNRWGLDAVKVGKIVEGRKVSLHWKGEILTSIDPDLLVENAPVYERPYSEWNSPKKISDKAQLKPLDLSLKPVLLEMLGSYKVASRWPIYQQYDQRVGSMTVRGAEADVAIQRLPDSHRGLAIAVGCRPRMMRLDARVGALDAVLYPSIQMSIKGASPVGLTDCLNFGNPEKPEIMSEFVASVEAICDASLALKAPVISGNVSFYNETLGKNITSTPAIGVVGLRPDVEAIPYDSFQKHGNPVFLVELNQIATSGVWAEKYGSESKFFGELDVKAISDWCQRLAKLCNHKMVAASQVVGGGGLGLSLATMALESMGFKLTRKMTSQQLLSENLYQVILEVDAASTEKFLDMAKSLNLEFSQIGFVQDANFELTSDCKMSCYEIRKLHRAGLVKEIESLQ